MTHPSLDSNDPFSIVVGFKFSDAGTFAFDQAARIALRMPRGAVHLVHVFETPLSSKSSHAMTQHLELYVSEKMASLGAHRPHVVGIHLREGDVAVALASFASEAVADLLVLGPEKHTVGAWFSPSIAARLQAIAPCPVVLMGPRPIHTAAPGVTIEPPCPECVTTRRATAGADWWCPRHSEHAHAAHTFSYQRELPFVTHDSQLGPTGI
jgi:Universal stress protein family